jgi:hypothetical protein
MGSSTKKKSTYNEDHFGGSDDQDEEIEIDEDEEDEEPEDVYDPETDCTLSPTGDLGRQTKACCEGKEIGVFESEYEAFKAIKHWQYENNYFPNIWYISDHGNVSLY